MQRLILLCLALEVLDAITATIQKLLFSRPQLKESKAWRCTSSAATRAVATGGGTEEELSTNELGSAQCHLGTVTSTVSWNWADSLAQLYVLHLGFYYMCK